MLFRLRIKPPAWLARWLREDVNLLIFNPRFLKVGFGGSRQVPAKDNLSSWAYCYVQWPNHIPPVEPELGGRRFPPRRLPAGRRFREGLSPMWISATTIQRPGCGSSENPKRPGPDCSGSLLRPHAHRAVVEFVHQRLAGFDAFRAGDRFALRVAHDGVAALEHRLRTGGFEAFPQREQAM